MNRNAAGSSARGTAPGSSERDAPEPLPPHLLAGRVWRYREGDSCSVEGCEGKVKGRWLCGMHYSRWLRHGTVELRPRPTSVYCKRGHDRSVVGVIASGGCAECNRMRVRRNTKRRLRKDAGYNGDPSPVPLLKKIRVQELGVTQQRLAEVSGLDRATIRFVENNPRRLARRTTVKKLVDAVTALRREARERERGTESGRPRVLAQKRQEGRDRDRKREDAGRGKAA